MCCVELSSVCIISCAIRLIGGPWYVIYVGSTGGIDNESCQKAPKNGVKPVAGWRTSTLICLPRLRWLVVHWSVYTVVWSEMHTYLIEEEKRFAAGECCMPCKGVVLVLLLCRIMVNCNLWPSKLVWIAWYWQWRVTYVEFWLVSVSGVICFWIWCSVWNVMSNYWLVRSR